jgi:hypothetical protein
VLVLLEPPSRRIATRHPPDAGTTGPLLGKGLSHSLGEFRRGIARRLELNDSYPSPHYDSRTFLLIEVGTPVDETPQKPLDDFGVETSAVVDGDGFQIPVQRRRQSQGECLSREWCHNATTVPLEGSGRYDEKVSSGVDATAYRSASSRLPEPACSGRFPAWASAQCPIHITVERSCSPPGSSPWASVRDVAPGNRAIHDPLNHALSRVERASRRRALHAA